MESDLNTRQQHILDILRTVGEVRIPSLKDEFNVTEMTIRRDLEKMEQLNFLRRTFGGAILFDKDVAIRERMNFMRGEKMSIGKKAAEVIMPGESVFIDGGTTTVEIARFIKPHVGITVVTNALNVAEELQDKGITVIITGGNLVDATSTMVGPIAVETISKMAFDRVFLGTTGFTSKHGFSNSNMHEADLKKIAITQASEANIVLDHTKFGAKMLVSFATIHQVHRIITDQLPGDDLIEEFRDSGVEILV
jgi:DeoR family fructose operon transcriptional repressor